MKIKEFKGFENIYPERFANTAQWLFGHWSLCSESYEVPDFNGEYPGTRLYIFHLDGTVHEPLKQEKNVFLERPVYNRQNDSFGIIRYDFNLQMIQALEYRASAQELITLVELPMSIVENLVNVRIIQHPFMLVKYEVHEDYADFLWPFEKRLHFEENEMMDFVHAGKIYSSKWIEDPEYREEIIVRDLHSGEMIERKPGYIAAMADGSIWLMTR